MARKKQPVSNRAGELLKQLRARAGLSIRDVADAAGYSRQAIHVAEVRSRQASIDVIMAFAYACGASRSELDRVPALTALDKGVLEVPRGTTERKVAEARRVLGG